MDADPDERARLMARWDLAGSAGAVCGPVLLAAVIAVGGGWRGAYLSLTALCALAWFGVLLNPARPADAAEPTDAGQADAAEHADDQPPRVRDVVDGGRKAARWLVLLEVANLLVDVLTGFAAVYLVDVVHTPPFVAALAIALRLGAALAGDTLLLLLLEWVPDLVVLRVSAVGAAVLYPGFLLVPGVPAKLAVLAALSSATATWYPLLQARLYDTVPSSVAVTLGTVSSMAGAVGPLAVGVAAAAFGLTWALAGLTLVPVALLVGLRRRE
jgi:FSR family fosmidomycin resistance protein-like MFS transporter